MSPGTRKAYRSHWRVFGRWCASNGLQSLPARPLTVAGYFMERFEDGLSLSALKQIRNAIAWHHVRADAPDNPTKDKDVRETLALLRRKAVKTGRGTEKQAVGVRLEHIREYANSSKPLEEETWGPDGVTWTPAMAKKRVRTLALLHTMHNALLRRSEAAALRWEDLVPTGDGKARLILRQSKTSDKPLYRLLTTRAWKYLLAMKPRNAKPSDRVFRVTSGRAIRDRIRVAMKGIRPGATGHSLRVGAAQDLTIRGASLQQVKEAGGWKTLHMPARYAEAVRPEVGAVNLLED